MWRCVVVIVLLLQWQSHSVGQPVRLFIQIVQTLVLVVDSYDKRHISLVIVLPTKMSWILFCICRRAKSSELPAKIFRNNSVVHTKFLCGFALAMLFLQTKILFSQEYDYSDSLLDEDIFVNENVPILTPPPLLHERTSTEFTILGKKLTSKFKMTDYHPGQQSEPLRYAVKTILTIINKEIREGFKKKKQRI